MGATAHSPLPDPVDGWPAAEALRLTRVDRDPLSLCSSRCRLPPESFKNCSAKSSDSLSVLCSIANVVPSIVSALNMSQSLQSTTVRYHTFNSHSLGSAPGERARASLTERPAPVPVFLSTKFARASRVCLLYIARRRLSCFVFLIWSNMILSGPKRCWRMRLMEPSRKQEILHSLHKRQVSPSWLPMWDKGFNRCSKSASVPS
mmetsp:Transcript_22221/g.56051  ORF Transcript_22221/g.56051 Transcript_22221/m.56051 type:complete len:204 (+) Transcript_22221:1172-1783(+)